MKILSLSMVFVLLLTTKTVHSQNFGPNPRNLKQEFGLDPGTQGPQKNELDSLITWHEQLVVHLDKPQLIKDTPSFFKAYTLTGPNKVRATQSGVLKVELVNQNQEIAFTQYHRIIEGMSHGTLNLPKKLKEGFYTLRAYTQWMQNYGEPYYFTRQVQVIGSKLKSNKKNEIETLQINFYPEGGSLVSGLNNHLLIKIEDNHGRPLRIDGNIVDENGVATTEVSSFEAGISSAIIKPLPNRRYKFVGPNGIEQAIPNAQDEGYVVRVNNLDDSLVKVNVQASDQRKGKKVYLKGEMDGVEYFRQELELVDDELQLDIPKAAMPRGFLAISLFDDSEFVWAKRQIFVRGNKTLNIEINPIANTANSGEATFKVKVTDSEGNPMETSLSLGATAIGKEDFANSFQIGQFDKGVDPNRRKERFLNDLMVLTKEDGKIGLSDISSDGIRYPFQKGLELYGHVYDLNNNLLPNTKIQVIAGSEDDFFAKEVITDAQGLLRLNDLQFVGETQFIFRTSGDDPKSRLVKFQPMDQTPGKAIDSLKKERTKPTKNQRVEPSTWRPIDSTNLVELEEVKISKERDLKSSSNSAYGVKATRVVHQDVDKPKTLPQLFLNIPGVQVQDIGGLRPRLFIPRATGKGPLIWVLDGQPLIQPTSLVDIMNTVSSADIERIEILFGPQAAVYGTRSSGGAILIYTRTGNVDYIKRKEAQLTFQGFHRSVNFESYQESISNKKRNQSGLPITLYWNPDLRTDSNGEVIVSFVPPSRGQRMELRASAVTEIGQIGHSKASF